MRKNTFKTFALLLTGMIMMTACNNKSANENNIIDSTQLLADANTKQMILGQWQGVRWSGYQDTLLDAEGNYLIPEDPMQEITLGDSSIWYQFEENDQLVIFLNVGTKDSTEETLHWTVKGDSLDIHDTPTDIRWWHIDTLTESRLVISLPNANPTKPTNSIAFVKK